MDVHAQKTAVFLSFCIEQYGKAKGMNCDNVVTLFGRYGVTEYLCDCYEVLHTQGKEWLMEEIDGFIEKRAKL